MQSNLDVAHQLYASFAKPHAETLLSLLHPEFEGVVTAGLPNDFGGTYQGPEAMLTECWARVFEVLDVRPVPSELLEVARSSCWDATSGTLETAANVRSRRLSRTSSAFATGPLPSSFRSPTVPYGSRLCSQSSRSEAHSTPRAPLYAIAPLIVKPTNTKEHNIAMDNVDIICHLFDAVEARDIAAMYEI
jgi:hypothetical protein